MNERGFMYPTTLCVCLLFILFFNIQLNHYITAKQFQMEIAYFERNHFYFLQSLKQIERMLIEDVSIERTGSFHYEKAIVNYEIANSGDHLLRITFRVHMDSRSEAMGFGYFDTEQMRIVKWLERK